MLFARTVGLPSSAQSATMEMNPKLAAQQTNLMLGGEKWEPSSTNASTYTWHDNGKAAAESKAQGVSACVVHVL